MLRSAAKQLLYELPEFEYFEPKTAEDAVEILHRYGGTAKVLAGGTDLLGLMKDRISGPQMPIPSALVNIKRIDELRRLVHKPNESIVGSCLTLTEISSDPVLSERFPGLAQAAGSVGTNQIRNMGTLGGNLCQRPWCWYFRHPAFECFKKGGEQCYAIAGDNSTYFSVYKLGICVMAHPSDTAPALMSLGARLTVLGAEGRREVELSEFFLGPRNVQDNILKPDELIVDVRIPRGKESGRSVYLKHRTRNNWDFALAGVAAQGVCDERGRIESARVVLGGVAPLPFVLGGVETRLLGMNWAQVDREGLAKEVVNQARPLRMNHYKNRIVKALVLRALDSVFSESSLPGTK